MKNLFTILMLFVTIFSIAQEKGTLQGKVLDKEAGNEPLPFANVFVKGTKSGTTTDMDGVYLFTAAPGTYTLVVSFVGYETVEIPNVIIKSGEVTTLENVVLGPNQGVALKEVVVKATTKKESTAALLTDQKKAVEIKTSIGAQELSAKGVGDVATAVTKITGISKQEGSGNVFVRGLGDRYNVTTLNGLPLPSNNPAKKNIELGLFSTDIVEFIGIDKTYNVTNYGDFAGANIDIKSKSSVGKGYFEVGVSSGLNTESASVDKFYLNEGPRFAGFYNTSYPNNVINGYNFTTSWDRQVSSRTPINSGISLKGGDSYDIGEESKLSVFGTASFDNSYSYRNGVSRGGVNSSGVPDSDFDYYNYAYNTNTTLMGNLGFKSGVNTLKYNVLYLNSSSQQQKEFYGVIDKDDDASEGGGFIQRAVFERTSLLINQLLGEHKLNEKYKVDWGVSYNILDNTLPNRRQNTVLPLDNLNPNGPRSLQNISAASDNHRYYHTLNEDEFAANLSASMKFKKNEEDEYKGKLTVGYSGRFKKVDFGATQFNFSINPDRNNFPQPIIQDIYDLDAYFNQANLAAGYFEIETFRKGTGNDLAPQTYGGDQIINAGYASVEYKLTPKFSLLAGIRAEQIYQFIEYNTILAIGDSKLEEIEILPSLFLKYELNEKQNLKFATSKTYTLPQFKERSPFLFQEVNQDYLGNPALYASTDYNVDFIWEYFPKSGEIISAGLFGKLIQNPINQTIINSASNDISWVNSGEKATAFGAEVELRKKLFINEREVGESTLSNSLTAGLNVSYMITDQDLDDNKVLTETSESDAGFPMSTNFTNKNSEISGASDLLINADISYSTDFSEDKNLLATVAFNYFSDRIYALGVNSKGNLIEKGYGTLDLILKSKLGKHLSVGLSAKNLLNPTIERFQDNQNIDVLSYKRGYDVKLSLAYKF